MINALVDKGPILILILCAWVLVLNGLSAQHPLSPRIYRFNFLVDLARHILLGKEAILNLLALERNHIKDSRKPIVEDGSLEDDQYEEILPSMLWPFV